jgi:LysM repeat protein
MDTISRENNSSMLPVGGIIVGVVALLLSGYAAITLSKVNKSIAAHEEKLAKIDGIETQVSGVASDVAGTKRVLADYGKQTNDFFRQVSDELTRSREDIVKLQDATKKPVAPAAGAKAGSAPAVAGPNQYIVKAGDTSGTKIATAHGVSLKELQDVNPGVNWNSLKIGQKLNLPTTAKK